MRSGRSIDESITTALSGRSTGAEPLLRLAAVLRNFVLLQPERQPFHAGCTKT